MVNQHYDIPRSLKRKCNDGSEALRTFYRHFFVDTYGLTRGEVDLSFLNDLSPQEIAVARDLVRRNLGTGYSHLIESAAALRDADAVPILRSMFDRESDLSRRLTISGSLWRLDRDPRFLECIAEMVASISTTLKEAHIDQILWIGDQRSVAYLIGLLDDHGRFVRYLALSRLNELEHGKSFVGETLPKTADDYKMRQDAPDFIAHMVRRLQQWNLRNGE